MSQQLVNNNSLPQSQKQIQATDNQEEEIRIIIGLPQIERTSEKLRRILRSQKNFTPKALCVNYFVNRMIEYLQKIKTILFIKLAVVTATQSTSVNLNGL